MAETVDCRSIQTEDEYSIISHPQQESAYPNFLPIDSIGHDMPSDTSSSPLRDDFPSESEHLSISQSHYALEGAYEHLKQNYSKLQYENGKLKKKLRASVSSESLTEMEQRASFQQMSSNHEDEVTRAWEAYSDKCRECEKLRDDLRSSEKRFVKTQTMMRDQARKEDALRVQAQLDQYKKKLQQAELEIRDHKHKEEMAREELQKEKEYHETILDVAKQRHEEMENTIKDKTSALQEKIRQCQELDKSLESQRQVAKAMTEKKEAQFNEKLREKEDEVIKQKEERALLEAHIAELEQWKQDVEHFHQSSGVPLNIPVSQMREEDVEVESCDEFDVTELIFGLRVLTNEINSLKQQASMQSSVLARMYQDPKVRDSIRSMNLNGFNISEGRFSSMPVQCSEHVQSFFTPSSFSSLDQRLLVEASPQSSDEFQSRQTRDIQRIVAARHAQIAVNVPRNSFEAHAHSNEIPAASAVNGNPSFSNTHSTNSASEVLHPTPLSEDEENVTSYYSTVAEFDEETSQSGHSSVQSIVRMRRNTEDSDTSSNTTLIDPGTVSTNIVYSDDITASDVGPSTSRSLSSYPPFLSNRSLKSQLDNYADQLLGMQRNQVERTLTNVTPGHDVTLGHDATPGHDVTPGHDRAIMAQMKFCPVCNFYFSSEATESMMQRHINGHFSEQEDEVA